ncbi:hypothetical protein [Streptomyces sp. NPDC001537]
MCAYITEQLEVNTVGKGAAGWFATTPSGLGATTALNPTEVDPVEAVMDHSGDVGGINQGRGAGFVFEAARERGPSSWHGP